MPLHKNGISKNLMQLLMIKIYQDLLLKKWIEVYDHSEKNCNVNKKN